MPFITEKMMDKELQEFELHEFGWWIEILTDKPSYIYYFGDFKTYWEAEWNKSGYVQDLEEEGAKIINIQVEQCKPKQLTISIMPFK